MRLFRIFAVCAMVSAVTPAVAASHLNGSAKASAPSGFTVVSIVTTDPNWLKKWNTPTTGVALAGTDTIKAGQKATLIVVFSNARGSGRTQLFCDVRIRHSVEHSQDKSSAPRLCYDGPVPPPNQLALTQLELDMQGAGKQDAAEDVRFDIGVTDKNGGGRATVALNIHFTAGRP